MEYKTTWSLSYRCRKRKVFSRMTWEFFDSGQTRFDDACREAEAKLKTTYESVFLNRTSVSVDLGEGASSLTDYFASAKVEDAQGEMDLFIKVFASDPETLETMVDSFFAKQGFLKYRLNGEFLTKAEREFGLAQIDAKIQEEIKRLEKTSSETKVTSGSQAKAQVPPQPVRQTPPQKERQVLGHCPNCVHCVKEWPYLYCSEITEKRWGFFGEEVMKKVDSNGTCDHFIAKKTSSNSNYRRD